MGFQHGHLIRDYLPLIGEMIPDVLSGIVGGVWSSRRYLSFVCFALLVKPFVSCLLKFYKMPVYLNKSLKELKQLLKERGVRNSGRKQELVDR